MTEKTLPAVIRIKRIFFGKSAPLASQNSSISMKGQIRGDKMEDGKIIERFWARDEAVLSDVSDKYGKYCLTIARNIVYNEQSAEECVQDTLLRLWETIPPNRPTDLQAFIGTVTRNIALDAVKAASTQKRGGEDTVLSFDEEPREISTGESTVEALAEQHELITEINMFLEGISSVKRRIFVLRYWHCFSVPDISRIVGMSAANVASNLKRVKKKLLEYLKNRGY